MVQLLTCFFELEYVFGLFEDIANHLLDGFVDCVEVVVLVEFVAGMEDVVDSLYTLRGIADFITDNPGLFKEEVVVDVDMLGP